METVGLWELDWYVAFPASIYLKYEIKANEISKNYYRLSFPISSSDAKHFIFNKRKRFSEKRLFCIGTLVSHK